MKAAKLVPDASPHSGRPRMVCSVCRKAAFATQEIADRQAAATGVTLRVYLGRSCGWYHLTSQPLKDFTAPTGDTGEGGAK